MSGTSRSSTPATASTARVEPAVGSFPTSLSHNDKDREDLQELCELAGVPMSRELLNVIHSLLSSPLNVSPTALFHVLKEATAGTQSAGEKESNGPATASSMVEVNGSLAKRKAQTPR